MQLVKAIVIDNDDSNFGDNHHLSRIQVRVIPEMDGIDATLLPWVRPWNVEGMSRENYSHHVPEIGSSIRCIFIDDYWKNGYYVFGQFIDGFFSWEQITKSLTDSISTLTDPIYPNPRFTRMPDGTIIFYNTVTRETGILHASGSYAIISATGGMNITAFDKVILTASAMNLNVIGTETETINNKTEIYAQHNEKTRGLKNENIGGSKKVSIGSSLAETVLDEKTETTIGNRTMTIGGNLTINLPNSTSKLEIDIGLLGKITADCSTGKVVINNNLEIDV